MYFDGADASGVAWLLCVAVCATGEGAELGLGQKADSLPLDQRFVPRHNFSTSRPTARWGYSALSAENTIQSPSILRRGVHVGLEGCVMVNPERA